MNLFMRTTPITCNTEMGPAPLIDKPAIVPDGRAWQ